jgi:ankyrin repeat protein
VTARRERQPLPAMQAIVEGNAVAFSRMLARSPSLATAVLDVGASRDHAVAYFFDAISHYVYEGDTPLHVAAAAHRNAIARSLLAAGANVHAKNRRGAEPLHYAVDGGPGIPAWDPAAQVETIEKLLAAGADPNATDKGGTTPLLRAVRNRCADAVRTLLEGGADPSRANHRGSTSLKLAMLTSGRGGTGSKEAKAQQVEIVRMLSARRTRQR